MNIIPARSEYFQFDNTYSRLPERFFARLDPTPVPKPNLIKVNRLLARYLDLDPDFLETPAGTNILAGNQVPEGAEPLAMAYAGHQFGGWVPQLGDGRAVLIGEVIGSDGRRHDIHLKGAGRTPFSRGGDGRAWIGPVLREYIFCEAMASLLIPTTRALAVVTSGETLIRESRLPGAVLARVASSHIRVGTFQYFSARQDIDALRLLSDHVIDRHYPEARQSPNVYLALLEGVIARQADLIAKWMGVGFIHGVMNTDNMSIAGETIDYGPCAFMDAYHPEMVFSSIDQMGRYAYGNQPKIAHWNLSCFASSILPLIDENEEAAVEVVTDKLNRFPEQYYNIRDPKFASKIGFLNHQDNGADLVQELLDCMVTNKVDFTLAFRRLCDLSSRKGSENNSLDEPFTMLFEDRSAAEGWLVKWRERLVQEGQSELDRQKIMRATNPAYIPRNHRVEQVISAALGEDFKPFYKLLDILSRPFDDQPENIEFQNPPLPDEIVHETFCGT
ncbi:MAG: YdiU family protein [Rhodospirillales bacterium]|nr:YdiU family protein [Rhodospirillales bacterium]